METHYANVYDTLMSLIPEPHNAWIHTQGNGSAKVTVTWTQKDLVLEKSRTFVASYAKSAGDKEFSLAGFPSELTNVQIYLPSPSGRYVAIIRVKEDNSPAAQVNAEYYIEIWDRSHMVCIIPTKGKLGYVYNDEWFGGASWSPDESKIVFPGQPFVNKGTSFWGEESKEGIRGHQYDFVEDWGEAYINKTDSRLYIVDVKGQNVTQLSGIPENLTSIGQASWSPDSKSLAFVAWPIGPQDRRLGIKYCFNRHSQVYIRDTTNDSIAVLASAEDVVARSPRFNLDGSKLVYLASGKVASHNTCHQLRMYDLENGKASTVVDIVDSITEKSFPGLFVGNLPTRCFIDNNRLLFDSVWHSHEVLLLVDISSLLVLRVIPKGSDHDAWTVADVVNESVVAIRSSLNSPPKVVFTNKLAGNDTEFLPVTEFSSSSIGDQLASLKWSTYTLGSGASIYQYMSLIPNTENPPVLVYAHGGPHSSFTQAYSPTVAFMALLGYAVILINYRGSLGFGKRLIDNLAGKIGDMDVADCIECLEHFIKNHSVNKDKIVYTGGSHGGFLGGHLIARDARFKAAVLRNPVTNIGAMHGVTDIPDWCEHMSQSKDLTTMFNCSPMSRVDNIKAPTLFLMGVDDKRVPTSQGIEMFYALKQRGVPTSMKMYPKNGHGISRAESEADAWVNAALWFNKYL